MDELGEGEEAAELIRQSYQGVSPQGLPAKPAGLACLPIWL